MLPFAKYLDTLHKVTSGLIVTGRSGNTLDAEGAVLTMGRQMKEVHKAGNKLMFVGNGGSAGICSHMAIDYSKNGGMRALAMNDGAALTCLGNDLGYENVFASQIGFHARPGDLLIAISSSGRSRSIVKAVEAARSSDCGVFTFSGFDADNTLRGLGDVNVYLDSREYGFVEVGHQAILHAILDLEMGWRN